MGTERSGSVLLSILLLTSLITPLLVSIAMTSVGTVEANPGDSSENWVVVSYSPQIKNYAVAVVGAGENIYIANSANSGYPSYFWRYNPSDNTWDDLAVPSGLLWKPGKPDSGEGAFKSGTCLAWDNGDYIYTLFGASYTDGDQGYYRHYFYRYSIPNDNWEQLENTPNPKGQGAGDAITWVPGNVLGTGTDWIYAVVGSKEGEHGTTFCRYNIDNNSWEVLSYNPGWTGGADDGSSLVWAGGDYLYALQGEWHETDASKDRAFARFDLTDNTWNNLPDIPEGGGVGDGGSLVWVGGGYSDNIYALGGGYVGPVETPGENFYCYSISGNSWTQLQDLPYGITDQNGPRLGYANENIYCWRGWKKEGDYPDYEGPEDVLWAYAVPETTIGVSVSISPSENSGSPTENLTYTVTVTNVGALADSYDLTVSDNAGWPLTLSDNLLEIPAGENDNVTLSVTIPGDAEYCTEDLITVTATSKTDDTVKDSASCIAHQDYFEKECMPDLGQHSENWSWVAAAANSIYWYSQHGYPELIDNIDDPTPYDNRYITDPLVPDPDNPAWPGHYVLFEVIASHCNRGYSMPVSDNDYLLGLRSFMAAQGAPLEVHEIIDPTWVPDDPDTLPLPLGENGVEWRTPTFEDYRRELLRCQDVILWLDLEDENIDHVVTGVAFFENQWILISDPWSTGAPDHNNDFENKQYDNCQIISEDPFRIFVPSWEQTALVPKMIYISPKVVENWTGTAVFSLVDLYTVNVEKILTLNQGSKLVVKFYTYMDAFENENVIETFYELPWHVEENESARHPEGIGVKKARLVLTTDDTGNVISTLSTFIVGRGTLMDRVFSISMEYPSATPEGRQAFLDEVFDISMMYPSAPP